MSLQMKHHFLVLIFLVFVCPRTVHGQQSPAFFTMQDSSFAAGNILRTYRIVHEFNGHSLVRPESYPFLDSFIVFLKNHPELKIEIGSFTGSRGTANVNQQISSDRANYIYAYLTAHGIPEKQLTAVGYGEAHLIYSDAA